LVPAPHSSPSFSALIDRARHQAQGWIEAQLRSQPQLNQIEFMVSGERNGQVVPLFSISVSRTDWQRQPHLETWVSYFGGYSASLLGFHGPSPDNEAAVSSGAANADPGQSFDGKPRVPANLDEILANTPPLLH